MKKKNGENIENEEKNIKESELEEDKAETVTEGSENSSDEQGKSEEHGKTADEAKEAEEEEKKAEEDSLHNKMLRLQADFLNYKNRTAKEKITTYGNAVADIIKDLLPVIDNLERAIEAEKSDGDSFKEGIVMIYNQLHDILAKRGLKEIEALDKPFDHNVHYGVAFDSESEKEDGTVIEVFQKGYAVNDRVIRPSMVKIVKK